MVQVVREFDQEQDYRDLVDWWSARHLPVTALNLLAKAGFVAESAEIKIAAAFVYQLDKTPMWWIEGIVSNPAAPGADRASAVEQLIEKCAEHARWHGAELVLGSSHLPSLRETFERMGFNDSGRLYNHLGRKP